MSAWIFCVECGRNFEADSNEATCGKDCAEAYERRKSTQSEDKKEESPK